MSLWSFWRQELRIRFVIVAGSNRKEDNERRAVIGRGMETDAIFNCNGPIAYSRDTHPIN
jgi:hypothetical protein